MDNGGAVLLLFALVDNLDAFPMGHVPILTFTKTTVHHAGSAQERHVALMQARQWAPGDFGVRRVRYALRLTPRR
jgi:hypothetical protein